MGVPQQDGSEAPHHHVQMEHLVSFEFVGLEHSSEHILEDVHSDHLVSTLEEHGNKQRRLLEVVLVSGAQDAVLPLSQLVQQFELSLKVRDPLRGVRRQLDIFHPAVFFEVGGHVLEESSQLLESQRHVTVVVLAAGPLGEPSHELVLFILTHRFLQHLGLSEMHWVNVVLIDLHVLERL